MATYDLGLTTGGRFHQYANPAGQVYYVDVVANTTSYSIPNGLQDNPGDTWARDLSKPWTQWNNVRTGRAILMDPHPTPPQTYLNIDNVKAALDTLVRVPESKEHVYRRPIGGILRFMFPEREGFDVIQEVKVDATRPDFLTFKVSKKPSGTLYQYAFLITESKRDTAPWDATEDQLHDHLAGNCNDSKNCYGMLQIGLEVQFYKHENYVLSKVGRPLHLIRDVNEVVNIGEYLKQNPMSFV